MRSYHCGPEWTREQWCWKDFEFSSKLQNPQIAVMTQTGNQKCFNDRFYKQRNLTNSVRKVHKWHRQSSASWSHNQQELFIPTGTLAMHRWGLQWKVLITWHQTAEALTITKMPHYRQHFGVIPMTNMEAHYLYLYWHVWKDAMRCAPHKQVCLSQL